MRWRKFTAPGRGDRLVQFIYTQLPYHPERIETGTAWMVDLGPAAESQARGSPARGPCKRLTRREPSAETEWRLRAYLQETISSADRKPGDTFQAVVSEPVFNAEHAVVVPQGSVLVGEVTQTKPARSFGRQGKLRFRFRQLKLPTGFTQPVEGTLAGVDANKSANLQIDSEGGIAPKPQNRVLLPLVLTFLAGRGLDDDGSRAAEWRCCIQWPWNHWPDRRHRCEFTERCCRDRILWGCACLSTIFAWRAATTWFSRRIRALKSPPRPRAAQ